MISTYSMLVVVCLLNPVVQATQYVGCFASPGDLVDQGRYVFQTLGYCRNTCRDLGQPVLGLSNGTNCFCGSSIPPANTMVEDSECNMPCPGYPWDMCGAAGFFSISDEEPVTETSATATSTAPPGTAQSRIAYSQTLQPEISQTETPQPEPPYSEPAEGITEVGNAQAVMSHYSQGLSGRGVAAENIGHQGK